MPDVISDTNGKLCVGSYHTWRLLSNPDNYSFIISYKEGRKFHMSVFDFLFYLVDLLDKIVSIQNTMGPAYNEQTDAKPLKGNCSIKW